MKNKNLCFSIHRYHEVLSNSPAESVYEVLNTEVVAIDFSTGNYFALIHLAKVVWQLIEKKTSIEAIAQSLAEHPLCRSISHETVLQDLHVFFAELEENHLIEPVDAASSHEIVLAIPPDWNYVPPRLQTYTDVQSLLLIDPIHEVSEAGWPMQ